jgi:hypothetical protein
VAQSVPIGLLMAHLLVECIAICCENHLKHMHTICGQNAEISNVNP